MPENQRWTDEELRAAVRTYAEMLRLEAAGRPYVKARFNEEVRRGSLAQRSRSSVELRWQNLSAVLRDAGKAYIEGYKPAKHVGAKVAARLIPMLRDEGLL